MVVVPSLAITAIVVAEIRPPLIVVLVSLLLLIGLVTDVTATVGRTVSFVAVISWSERCDCWCP